MATDDDKVEHEAHEDRKTQSREEKENDKPSCQDGRNSPYRNIWSGSCINNSLFFGQPSLLQTETAHVICLCIPLVTSAQAATCGMQPTENGDVVKSGHAWSNT